MSATWSTRDGRTALTTSYVPIVRLWDVETGLELKRFNGHRNWVWSVDIAPDGKTFVTAGGGTKRGDSYSPGDDFTIRLWKMPAVPILGAAFLAVSGISRRAAISSMCLP